MKKVLKVIFIIVVVVVALCVALLAIASYKGDNYWKYTETSGNIEAKYTALGEHKVSCKEYDANDAIIGKYAVWYPDDLESSDNKYPVVVFANGTGSTSILTRHSLSIYPRGDLLQSETMTKTLVPVLR